MPHTKHAFLSNYPAVHSHDSEFARDRLFSVFGANGFESTKSNFGLHANFVQLSGIGLSYCCYDQPAALTFPEAVAAWIIASRRGDWNKLLAATFVTVALAIPVLVMSALWEVYLAPHVLHALIG